jgi:hypothetical protein
VELSEKIEGRLITAPRLLIRVSLVRVQPGEPITSGTCADPTTRRGSTFWFQNLSRSETPSG